VPDDGEEILGIAAVVNRERRVEPDALGGRSQQPGRDRGTFPTTPAE
jgi:hypothetical protein